MNICEKACNGKQKRKQSNPPGPCLWWWRDWSLLCGFESAEQFWHAYHDLHYLINKLFGAFFHPALMLHP